MVHYCILSIGVYSSYRRTDVLWYYKSTFQKLMLKTSARDPNVVPYLIVRPRAFDSRDCTRAIWEVYNTEKGKNNFTVDFF